RTDMARRPSRREFFSMATAAGLGALLASALARAQTPSYAIYPDIATRRLKIRAPKGVDIVEDQAAFGIAPATYDVLVRQESNGDYVAYDRNGNVICKNSSTACIQEALNYKGPGSTVFIAPDSYVLSSQVSVPPHTRIVGAGWNSTVLRESPSRTDATPLIYIPDAYFVSIENLRIEGNAPRQPDNTNYIAGADLIYATRTSQTDPVTDIVYSDSMFLLRNVIVAKARGHGVFLYNLLEPILDTVRSYSNAGNGFRIISADTKVVNCVAGNNGNSGFAIYRNTVITASKSFGSGFVRKSSPNLNVDGTWAEFFITGPNVVLSGVEAGEGRYSCYTIYNTRNVVIFGSCYDAGLGNYFINGTDSPGPAIQIDSAQNVFARIIAGDFIREAWGLPKITISMTVVMSNPALPPNNLDVTVLNYSNNDSILINSNVPKGLRLNLTTLSRSVTKNSGVYVASGDGITKRFVINHGLYGTPRTAIVTKGSTLPDFKVSVDDTNIYVDFVSAPPSGTNNIVLYWYAEI
ncbi:hypothetical protein, partial [Pyrobaculum sp.]|uniref:hypothetical protein n=1 Tax=Pyrobaculum sp. TaxID=2004705 RepID=UPI003D0DB78E